MDILDDMGVSKLSAKVFFKLNYSNPRSNPFHEHGTQLPRDFLKQLI